MKQPISLRRWLSLAKFWDALCAYAEQGWKAVAYSMGWLREPRRQRTRRRRTLAFDAL